jgi:hypothetical protein
MCWSRAQSGLMAATILLVVGVAGYVAAATIPDSSSVEAGYRQMYNLDFDGAHRTFQSWEHEHPQDPLGPASNAAAYLFAEFARLHILESELFTDDERFAHRDRPSADPKIQATFESELKRAEQMADQNLSHSPDDHRALFTKVLVGGLRGDYIALIQKRNLAALSSMKASRLLAERLLAEDPSYYDAYLAVGVENYLLGTNPAPVRWLLHLTGAQTDKSSGLTKLQLTAEKGHYLAPFARLLLAVAALRDHDRSKARDLLSGLAQEFPQNPLYRRELDRIAR